MVVTPAQAATSANVARPWLRREVEIPLNDVDV
jgi:hypothetical protein